MPTKRKEVMLRKLCTAVVAITIGLTTGAAAIVPASAHTSHYYTPPSPPRRPAPVYRYTPVYHTYSSTDAIATAAARWGVSYGWLLRVAECESGLNPSAYNPSGASGLFQFMPSTYYLYAGQIGEARSYWDAYGSANVAGYMFSRGLSYQWTCR